MLKLGVVDRGGIHRPRTLLGRRRYVSFLLLRDLADDPAVAAEEYDRLAGHACMPNGVWKLTHHGRLRLLDEAVLGVLRARHAGRDPLVVCDLAASTGATSVDFFRALAAEFDVRFVASDLYRDLIAVRRGRTAVVFDGFGEPVQYLLGPLVMPESPAESAAYPVNRLAKAMVRRRFAPAARAVLGRVDRARLGAFESTTEGGFEIVKLPMLTRDTLATLRAGNGFSFEEWNIFEPLPLRGHVVRAMNILTPEHFSDERRVTALRNCVAATLPGGLFVVGSSPSAGAESVQASIYAVDGDRLERVADLNGGSEIDRLIARHFTVVEAGRQAARPEGADRRRASIA